MTTARPGLPYPCSPQAKTRDESFRRGKLCDRIASLEVNILNLMPRRTMVPDYAVGSNARNRTISFFRSVCFFPCKKSLCYFHYFNFT